MDVSGSPEMQEFKRRAAIVYEAWWEQNRERQDIDITQTSRKTHFEAFVAGYVAGAIGLVAVTEEPV